MTFNKTCECVLDYYRPTTVTRDCDNLLVDSQKQFCTNTNVFDFVFCFPSFIHTMIFICVSLFKGGESSSQFQWFGIAKIEL